MYLRTKGIKINLDLEVTLYLRTQSIRMTPQTQLIFDKSDVRSLSLKKKGCFTTNNQKEKTHVYYHQAIKICSSKNII
jgi:hypothetical protein